MKETIESTTDYSIFIDHAFNRAVNEESKKFKKLLDSMRKYGWIGSKPASCVKNGKGLKIVCGHHRFRAAQILGIPVKYVVEKTEVPIYVFEDAGVGRWTPKDFAESHKRAGVESYDILCSYIEETGISLGNAAAMFYGDSAGTGNYDRGDKFNSGMFEVKDVEHPGSVGGIVLFLKKIGVKWASDDKFVKALSRVVRVEEFDASRFKKKARAHAFLFQKQRDVASSISMIEEIYNRQAIKSKCLPLSFLVEQKMAERNVINRKNS